MTFADHFSKQAGAYTQFRPRYPRALFAFLATLPAQRESAWDCGTGNGQAAVDLAEHFARVLATDPSSNQIAHAQPHPRVEYLVARAEACPLADQSVDLITVAQALHWFDRPAFYREVRRVGSAGSVLAAWSYGLAAITAEIDRVVWRLYEEILGEYWPPERRLIELRYTTLDFPFVRIDVPEFSMTVDWQLADLLGYLTTWSSLERYQQQRGENPLALVERDLTAAWGDPATVRTVRWPLFLLVGQIAAGTAWRSADYAG
ncbi:MAG: class I SAM-dependent methyltransferase [Pirellulales bacterium]